MNILVFNWRDITHPWAGGAEVNIHEIAKVWAKQGHNITLFCGAYENSKPNETIDGINIIRKGDRFSVYLHAFWQYLTSLHNQKFDVIIDDVNGIPFFTPLFSRKPKIAMFHHAVDKIFFKELPYLPAIVGYSIEKIILPLLYRNTKIVAVSESSRKDLIKLGLPKDNILVVHNGLNHAVVKPNFNIKTTKPTICYVGRIRKYKRLDLLIEMMTELIKGIPDLRLVIAGEGDASDSIKTKIRSSNLSENVKFLGHVTLKEKIEILQKSWLFVTPSEKEGWGITVLEANACGTPVVAFDVPGLTDSVVNGKTGFLVNDRSEFLKKIEEIITNKELRNTLSKEAVEWSKNFDWEKSSTALMNLLTELKPK